MFPVAGTSLFLTERLEARRLTADDAVEMVSIFGDVESMRFVGDSQVLSEEECRQWVVDVTERNFIQRGYGLIAFFSKDGDEMVACGGVFHPDQQPEPELMYWVRREHWGKGYATEIVKRLVEYAKDDWGIGHMIATIHPDNLPSQRVIAKAGFHHAEDRIDDDGSVTQVWVKGD